MRREATPSRGIGYFAASREMYFLYYGVLPRECNELLFGEFTCRRVVVTIF